MVHVAEVCHLKPVFFLELPPELLRVDLDRAETTQQPEAREAPKRSSGNRVM